MLRDSIIPSLTIIILFVIEYFLGFFKTSYDFLLLFIVNGMFSLLLFALYFILFKYNFNKYNEQDKKDNNEKKED